MSDTDQKFHRKIAAECFNNTWKYLKQENRKHDDDQMMLNLAHSSRYHWSLIGKPANFAIGDWQISRVYSALNQPDMAMLFAKSCIETCRRNNLSGWLLASSYEGMARAYVANRAFRLAGEYLDKARQQLKSEVMDEEDVKNISDQIDETDRMIPK